MTIERIKERIATMNDAELIKLNNDTCAYILDSAPIYPMSEFNEMTKGMTPLEIAVMVSNGEFDEDKAYFRAYEDAIEVTDYPYNCESSWIDVNAIAEYILETETWSKYLGIRESVVVLNLDNTDFQYDKNLAIEKTCTISELISYLERFDDDAKVAISADNRYSYRALGNLDILDE